MADKPLVVIIAGQTASGKSTICMELANRLEGEILSMDAIKVYRGMDIGSAKPDQAARDAIPHHMLDLCDASEAYSVAAYLEALEPTLQDVISRGKLPIIDCGTPMYLQAFLSGMVEGPKADAELRASLEARSNEDLMRELAEVDPAAAERLHINDTKRIVRALEYATLTGEAISDRQDHFGKVRDDYRFMLTGPLWAGETLRPRINARIQGMLAQGLVDEVREIAEGSGFSQPAQAAIGYRQILDHLAGELSLEEAVTKIENRTWNLARKQLMWFKRHQSMKWQRVSSDAEFTRSAIFLATEVIGELNELHHGLPIGMDIQF